MPDLNPRHNMSLLVYGKTKTGKSSLAATAPGKKLALDAEGSWNAFEAGRDNPNRPGEKYRVTYWDDLSQPPPDMTDYDICVVDVLRWETVDHAMKWVNRTDHPFQSIIMDSVTEVQNRCKKATVGLTGLQFQDWGALLAHMSECVKGYRDIVKNVKNPVRCMVFTSEGKDRQNGTYTPQMEGSLRDAIAYWMNTTACLKTVQVANQDGIVTDNSPVVRRLLVKPHPLYITGSHFEDRFDKNTIDNPNIAEMMSTIFPGFVSE